MAIFRLGFDALLLAAEFQTKALAPPISFAVGRLGVLFEIQLGEAKCQNSNEILPFHLKFKRNSFASRSILTCIDSSRDSFKIWNPAGMFVASLLVFIYLFLIIIFRRKNNPINATGTTASTKIIKRC